MSVVLTRLCRKLHAAVASFHLSNALEQPCHNLSRIYVWRIVKRYVDSSTRHCAELWSIALRLLNPVATPYEHRNAPFACAPLASSAEQKHSAMRRQAYIREALADARDMSIPVPTQQPPFSYVPYWITLDHSRSAKLKPPLMEA